jgi:hypothetical protein
VSHGACSPAYGECGPGREGGRTVTGGSAGVYPLSNFGSWTLTGATVKAGTTAGTISTFPDAEITMANSGGKVKAQPGPLNATGKSFKVTWKSST